MKNKITSSVPGMNFVKSHFDRLSPETKGNLFLKSFALFKIPLILMVSPKVITMNDEVCEIKLPLNRMTRNHYNSLYFGALAIAGDLTAGTFAMYLAREQNVQLSLLFKDFKASFLKRCEADTLFRCSDGALIREKINEALASKERVNFTVKVSALVPEKLKDEPAALLELTMSIKVS